MYYKSITFKFIHTLLKVFFIAAGIFSFSHAFAASVDFRINGDNLPVTAEYGENLTLSWTSYQATSCSGSSNMPPISGTSGTVNAPNTGATYVITCQDALGNIMKDSVYSYYANQITIDRQDYEGGNPPDTTEAKIDPYDFLSANPATFTDLVFGDGPTGSAHTSTFTPLLGRQLAHLLVNGVNVSTSTYYTLSNIIGDRSVLATFKPGQTTGTGPKVYYPFTAPSVPIPDMSGNDYTGVLMGNAIDAPGHSGSGTTFDGDNDWIDMKDLNAVDGATTLTVALWVKLDDLTRDNILVSKGSLGGGSTAGVFTLWRDEQGSVGSRNNTFAVILRNAANTNSVRVEGADGIANDNNWHHVAFTYSATQLRLFVDGVEDPNSPVSTVGFGALKSTNDPLEVARSGGAGATALDGTVDDVTIYTRALSTAEISQLYQNTITPSISDMGIPHITPTGVIFEWTTSEAADSQVEYGTTLSYGNTTTLVPIKVGNHAAILTGLAPETTYFYRLRSANAFGVPGYATGSFTTEPRPTVPHYYIYAYPNADGSISNRGITPIINPSTTGVVAVTEIPNFGVQTDECTYPEGGSPCTPANTFSSAVTSCDGSYCYISTDVDNAASNNENVVLVVRYVPPPETPANLEASYDGACGPLNLTWSPSIGSDGTVYYNIHGPFNYGSDYVARTTGTSISLAAFTGNYYVIAEDSYGMSLASNSVYVEVDGGGSGGGGGADCPSGTVRIKMVGPDETDLTLPTEANESKVDTWFTGDNPFDFVGLVPGAHTAGVKEVSGYGVVAGTCPLYAIEGGTECNVSTYNLTPTCAAGYCSISTSAVDGSVRKVAFKYVGGSVRIERKDNNNAAINGVISRIDSGGGSNQSSNFDHTFTDISTGLHTVGVQPASSGSYDIDVAVADCPVSNPGCPLGSYGPATLNGVYYTRNITVLADRTQRVFFRYTPELPTATISANPTVVGPGGTTVLTWSSTNAQYCTGGGHPDWQGGGKQTSGVSAAIIITADTTFTIFCTDSLSNDSQTVSVTVTLASGASCTDTPDGSTILNGQSRRYYQTPIRPPGGTCQYQNRTCNNGTLEGDSSYRYRRCLYINYF